MKTTETRNRTVTALNLAAVAMAILVVTATSAQEATVVVKWGEPGGDTGIITGGSTAADNPSTNTTFTPGNTVTDPVTYYGGYNPATDTPLFNGAGTNDGNLDIRDIATGDAFYYPILFGAGGGSHQFMFAWEIGAHTLNSGGILNNFTIENQLRDGNNSGTVRFLFQQSGSQWYISQASSPLTTAYTQCSVDPSTLSWFNFTPFAGGAFTIGAAASPTFDNYTAVGFFGDCSTTSNWADIRTRYFQVTAVPEPSATALSSLGLLSLGMIGRRPRRRA